MSTNKIYVCAVDMETGETKKVLAIAKSSGGAFGCYADTGKDMNDFLLDAFIDGNAIAFKDDSGLMSPLFCISSWDSFVLESSEDNSEDICLTANDVWKAALLALPFRIYSEIGLLQNWQIIADTLNKILARKKKGGY